MFPFTRRRPLLPAGYTDHHAHLLPGVDDGVRSLQEALAALALLERHGVERLWLTPHIMEDMPNTPEALLQGFEGLRRAYTGTVRLHLAAEHMLDALFERRLAQGQVLPMRPGGLADERPCLLVETSCFTPPMNLYGLLEQVKDAGYTPLLAHPERYLYMEAEDYRRLLRQGVRLQLNLPALAGLYGAEPRRRARALQRHGAYSLSGCDIHSLRQAEWLCRQRV